MSFGENLKRFRKEREWTQYELASRIGTQQTHISRLEKGEHYPDFIKLKRLCSVLECTATELMGF